MECERDGKGPKQAGAIVVHGVGQELRSIIATATADLDAGGGLRQLLPARALGPWAVVAEGVGGGVHDVRLALADFLVPEAHTVHCALAIVFHHHVGGLQQLPEDLAPLLLLEVDLDAALAAIHVQVSAVVVGTARVVDLDDVGTELAKGAPACGARQYDAQVEDPHALQGGQDILVAFEALSGRRGPDLRQRRNSVLTQRRRAARRRSGGSAHSVGRAGLLHSTVFGVIHLHHHSGADGVLVHHPLVHGLTDGAGAAGLGDSVLPFLGGLFLEQVLDAFPPHLDSVRAHIRAVEVLQVLDPLRPTGGLQELAGEALVHPVILDIPSVGTLVLVGHHIAREGEQVRRIDVVELGQVPAHGSEHGAVQRHLDALPLSGALTGDQGHGHRHGADDGREAAGAGQGQEQRLVHPRRPLMRAGGRPNDVFPAPLVAIRAVFSEPGQGTVDQPGIAPGRFVADAQPVRDTGPEVLDQDIGPADELRRSFSAFGGLQVQLDGALAAVPGGEGRLAAGGVAPGPLDLDDIGALLGEQHSQQRAGDVLSEFHNPYAAQCTLGIDGLFCCTHWAFFLACLLVLVSWANLAGLVARCG